jgi:outer membrane protein OmpA-like peptidoglycan-associated protein
MEGKVVKKLFPLALLAASVLVLLLASCATTKSGKTGAAAAKTDKTAAAPAKSDKAPAAAKSDKATASAPKSDKTAAAAAATKGVAAPKSDKEIADDLAKRIKAAGLKNVDVKTTKRGVTITAGALNFPGDAATITADTAKRLDAIARLLKGYEGKKLLIQGHTADVGDKKSQQELSLKRAKAVGDYFVRKGVVKAAQLVIEGKGGSVPLAKNDTEQGRAKNRRVEITLLR